MKCSGVTSGGCEELAVGVWFDVATTVAYPVCAWKLEAIERKAREEPGIRYRRFRRGSSEPRRSRA